MLPKGEPIFYVRMTRNTGTDSAGLTLPVFCLRPTITNFAYTASLLQYRRLGCSDLLLKSIIYGSDAGESCSGWLANIFC